MSGRSVLDLKGASKEFFGVRVLEDVDLRVEAGEIHALLGQNGSGKSTLIKILSGFYPPDGETSLRLNGKEVRFPITIDPSVHGMAFVHQNLGLAEDMSVLDNLALGEYVTWRHMKIDWRTQRELALDQAREFGLSEDLDLHIEDLSSPAQKALIAVARAVTRIRRGGSRGLLVLDEPTVYLPRPEVDHLQQVVRRLTAEGVGVLYVTHRLDELQGFADRATILRDGRKVGEVDIGSANGGLIEMITGSKINISRPSSKAVSERRVALAVSGLRGRRVEAVTFKSHQGEILGLAGLVGMGQDEILSMVFGASARTAGKVTLEGALVSPSPQQSIRAGIAYLPSDRPGRSGAMTESVGENITLPVLRKFFFGGGKIDQTKETRHISSLLGVMDVRPPDASLELERLSGGNQQKALLGKWLQTEPKVLLLDEPVQGVDIGAKAQIFLNLRQIASAGCSVLIASSEYEDLAVLCDRVLILVEGVIVDELVGSAVNTDDIAGACFGAANGRDLKG